MAKKITVNVNANAREPQHLAVGDIVQFVASAECDLYFTDPAVFGTNTKHLTPGNNPIEVKAGGATTWNALTGSKKKAVAGEGNPNEIVVP